MNKHIFFAAAALFAAPVCLCAEATPCQAFMMEAMAATDELAAILEKASPATADACVAEMDALMPKLKELAEKGKQFSEAEQQAAMKSPEISEKVQATMGRLMAAAVKLGIAMQTASDEDRAKLEKLLGKLQELQPAGAM